MKKKIQKKLEAVFQSMACEEPYEAVHKTALAAAAIVAVCPMPTDAWCLRVAEVFAYVYLRTLRCENQHINGENHHDIGVRSGRR